MIGILIHKPKSMYHFEKITYYKIVMKTKDMIKKKVEKITKYKLI